jgi:hypothetical protein
MKKWLDKYQSKGEVKKKVYQYTPQNLTTPNFNGLAATTYDVTPTNNMLPEVVIKAKRIKPQANFHLNLQNQIFANNTRDKVLANRRNYYFPYETEQTKNIRNLADDQVFKSSGDLVSAIHPVGAIINALYQGADKSLPLEGIKFLPNNIPFKQAKTYNNLIPILKPVSRIVDPIQMFDKLHIADSLYKSADSIDLYNQFKEGGLVSKNSLNRKVTCSNCGWSWKLSDGGMDPMTCHKCGGDIKMREGGELDQYQDKGQVNFRDRLLQQNRPIIENTKPYKNLNISYTPTTKDIINNYVPVEHKLSVPTKRGVIKTLDNVLSNPMTSVEQLINKKPITGLGKRNNFDYAIDVLNPLTYAHAIKNTGNNLLHPIETSGKLGNAAMGSLEYIVDGKTNRNVGDGYGVVMDAALALPTLKSLAPIAKKDILYPTLLSAKLNSKPTFSSTKVPIKRIDPINRSSVNINNDIYNSLGKDNYDKLLSYVYNETPHIYDNPLVEFKNLQPNSYFNIGFGGNTKYGTLLKEKFCPPGSECAKTANAVTSKTYTDITGKPFDATGNAHNAWHMEDQMTRNMGVNVTGKDIKVGDRVLMGNEVDQSTYAPGYFADDRIRHAGMYAGVIPTENGLQRVVLESGKNNPLFINPINETFTGPNSVVEVVRPGQFKSNFFGEKLVDKNIRYAYRDKPSVAEYSSDNKHVQNIIKQAEPYREVIKRTHDLTNDEFDELLNNLVGVGLQETKLNAKVGSSFLPTSKIKLQNLLQEIGATKPIKQVLNKSKSLLNSKQSINTDLPEYPGTSQIEMEAAKLANNNKISFEDALSTIKSNYQPKPKYTLSTVEPSKGQFRQKFQTEAARTAGAKTYIPYDDVFNGLSQMSENYKKVLQMYPNASPRELVDLTTLMWNSPGKAANKTLTDFYLFKKGNPNPNQFKFNYIDKVNNLKNQHINIKPKLVEPHNEFFRNKVYPEIQYQKGGSFKDQLLQQNKYGGPIITNRGQWDYPGQTTIIPSNKITMEGVNGPLYLQPNKGKGRLAYPNEEHYFPKASFVVEHPIKWQIIEN